MRDNGILYYRRFLDGDEQGLEALISLYRHGLLRFIYAYVKDEALAEDVLTDVFFTLYYKRSFQEQDGATLKSYLYKIARNKSLNLLKKQKRRREISLDALTFSNAQNEELPRAFLALKSDMPTPDEALERKEDASILYRALANIREEYKEVLLLRYIDGMSPEEIAKVLKKGQKQVYNLLSRGKAALKKELQSKELL